VEQNMNLSDQLRRMAIETCDDGTGSHIETLWWEAADEIDRLNAIVSQLEVTADGVVITPKTQLWQIDPDRMLNDGEPWKCYAKSVFRVHDLTVFSTKEAALNSTKVD